MEHHPRHLESRVDGFGGDRSDNIANINFPQQKSLALVNSGSFLALEVI